MESPLWRRMPATIRNLLAIIILGLSISCSESGVQIESSIHSLKGRDLAGNPVDFSHLDSPRFVLNFYSPTCQPCIEELPALGMFYRTLKEKGIPVYIVVEGRPDSHGLMPVADTDVERIYTVIRDRLEEDVAKYGIEVPMVVLDPSVQMSSSSGLITGTPETLIFHTSPLSLEYNFLGPIASSENRQEVLSETRYQFALKKALGETL